MTVNNDRRKSLPKPIPVLRGEAAERFLKIANTPLTEEEIQSIDDAVERFHAYLDRLKEQGDI